MPGPARGRIVIAVDGSENSRRAVAYVGRILGGLGAFTTILLHVIHVPEEDFFASPQERDRWMAAGRKKVDAWLTVYRDMLVAAGIAAAAVVIHIAERDGPSLARLILDEAALLQADTIVVGRQGLSRKEEFLFGSVSRQIVSHARNCAAWVVQ